MEVRTAAIMAKFATNFLFSFLGGMFGEKATLCDDVIFDATVWRSEPMRGEQKRPAQICFYRRTTISTTPNK